MTDHPLPITSSDIAMGNLDIKKIIVQQKSDRVVAFFSHTEYPGENAFTATVKFYMKDEGRWITSIRIYEGSRVVLNDNIKSLIQRQLTKIFSPYFDELIEGHKPW